MRSNKPFLIVSLVSFTLAAAGGFAAERSVRLSDRVENLLVRAKVSGNLESFDKGLRGAPQELVYDPQQADFVRASQGYTNVVLEIANEFGHSGYNHRILRTPEGQVELIELARRENPKLLISTRC